MVTPKKINASCWNLNRCITLAVCLGILVVYPTSIGGEIISFTGPDGRRIYSNTPNIAIPLARSSPTPEPSAPLRTRRSRQLPARISRLIDRISRKHEIDPELVKVVARVESNYNPRATSHKGALGIMQLLPATAKRFGVSNAYDPAQNIEGGVRYLKFLSDRFRGNLSLVLAGYNAGENAVQRHGGIPPYRETQEYVRRIRRLYEQKLSDSATGDVKSEILSYRDSAGRQVYSNLESSYR